MRTFAVTLLVLVTSVPAGAQVVSRPAPEPDRTAAGESWYASRRPVMVNGDTYVRAGASVFFDGNTMVQVGRVAGVPVYADVTIEPGSVVLVPIGRGLMQPYERRRTGDLAGTTGSRAPSFPVGTPGLTGADPNPPGAPMRLAAEAGARTAEPPAATPPCECAAAVPLAGPAVPAPAGPVWTTIRPVDSRGFWIPLDGSVWTSDGPAERYDAGRFQEAGTYAGRPTYRLPGEPDRVYLPVADGFVAPYHRTDDAAR